MSTNNRILTLDDRMLQEQRGPDPVCLQILLEAEPDNKVYKEKLAIYRKLIQA